MLSSCQFAFKAGDLALQPFDAAHRLGALRVRTLEGRAVLLGQGHDAAGHLANIQILAALGRYDDGDVLFVQQPLPADELVGRRHLRGRHVRVVEVDRNSLSVGQLEDRGDHRAPLRLERLRDLQGGRLDGDALALHHAAQHLHLPFQAGEGRHQRIKRQYAFRVFDDLGSRDGIKQQVFARVGTAHLVEHLVERGIDGLGIPIPVDFLLHGFESFMR